jgi:predicted outer membrane repeat protein
VDRVAPVSARRQDLRWVILLGFAACQAADPKAPDAASGDDTDAEIVDTSAPPSEETDSEPPPGDTDSEPPAVDSDSEPPPVDTDLPPAETDPPEVAPIDPVDVPTAQDVASPWELPGCTTTPDPALLGPCTVGVAAWIGSTTFPSVQAAIDAAAVSDTVVVCPGVHPGPVAIATAISLIGAAPNGAVVIDGGGGRRIIEHTRGLLTLRDLTLRGGHSAQEGGAVFGEGGTLVVECSLLEDNDAIAEGGAIHVTGPFTLRSSVLRHNTAGASGGAVHATGSAVLEDALLHDNHAEQGGALSLGAHSDVRRLTFRQNEAAREGGALLFEGREAIAVDIEDTTFAANRAGLGGAAIDISRRTEPAVHIRRSRFIGNEALGGTVLIDGDDGFSLTMEDCELVGNRADDGATLRVGGFQERLGALTLLRTTFADNLAPQGVPAMGTFGLTWGPFFTNGVTIEAEDITVHRNRGVLSAFALRLEDTFVCRRCDFGAGADDNSPSDISHDVNVLVQAPANFQL